jgi:hypothetical protein
LNAFIPTSYSNFADKTVRDGTNIHCTIGFELFTAADLSLFFENQLIPRITAANEGLSDVQKIIATCAALVFPDRVPWHLLIK